MAADRLPIGGLKLSSEMVLIRLLPDAFPSVVGRISRLAAARINLSFVSLGSRGHRFGGACCVAAADREGAEQALAEAGGWAAVAPVGALTVFPHRSRSALLSRIFATLAAEEVPVLSVATSFSSLTLVTDHRLLDRAVGAVARVAELPENHAPFHPAFRVRQV
jgi:hypothetical protein